jgi:hypothetical protein
MLASDRTLARPRQARHCRRRPRVERALLPYNSFVSTPAELKVRTLTALYNARPAWLDLAHRALDATVLAAYGWPADLPDEQVRERLLALNLARAGREQAAA